MQFVSLKGVLPRSVRRLLRKPWDRLLVWEQSARERAFYRRFINSGDLVFDVGANVGGKTAAFLAIGARVVAVEPNPECAATLLTSFRRAISGGRLTVEAAAASSSRGEVTLTTFSGASELSSGSAEFYEYATYGGYIGAKSVTVPAITLDDLISRYGLPTFIKIDVEGMDGAVLRALTRRPKVLSFEYNTAPRLWANTLDCFHEAERLGFREANLTKYADPRLILSKWVPIAEVSGILAAISDKIDDWGDVIVR